MPPADDSKSVAEREFDNHMEIGKMYFKERNYRGAEFRFRDALLRQPESPEATFQLAESLDRQHKNDQARTLYQAYLKLQSAGPRADLAQKRLQHLTLASDEKN